MTGRRESCGRGVAVSHVALSSSVGSILSELPALLVAEVGDVGDVVAGVPGVDEGGEFDCLGTVFWVAEASLPFCLGEGLEEHDPAGVEAFDELEGPLDGGGGVMEGGPGGLVVGLDGGPVFGEGEADTYDGVYVAVRDVVDDLTEGPAAFAVWGVELRVSEALDGVAEFAGEIGEGCDGTLAVVHGDDLGPGELPYGVACVDVRGCHFVPLDSEEQS